MHHFFCTTSFNPKLFLISEQIRDLQRVLARHYEEKEREEGVISPPSWNQRTWKSSWGIGLYKWKYQFIEPCMIVTVREVFKQKLCNELRELRDYFFAKHFLLFRNIAYNPWIFYCKKESLNSASSYQEDAKILIRVAAIITQEKKESFVCLLEKYLRLYMIKWLH